jgi:tetratricopeptide (TPR) repeat protein
MSENPNKLIRFWQELKRRKVFKVIAMYAGTAFIILEVVNNLVSPLRLPEWAATFVVVLLATGFPFAIIFSWIFDITPEGLKKTESVEAAKRRKSQAVQVKRRLRASDIIIAAMAIVIVILLYPKIFKKDTLEKLRTSGERIVVAVMPFQNMTNDTIWNIWQNGIQSNLITSLSNTEELKVRQTETTNDLLKSRGVINYASITPSVASSVSKKLDADIFIYGSINQAGATIRVNLQLIDSKTEEVFKSYQLDGSPERILNIIDSISMMVKNFLVISKLEKELPRGSFKVISTNSPEAYRYFINGANAFDENDYHTAVKLFSQALETDSNFVDATIRLSYAYFNQNLFEEGKRLCLKVYAKRDQMPFQLKLLTNFLYSIYFETPYESIACLRQLQNFDDQVPSNYYNIATFYYQLYQYDKAIPEFEKALELFNKWDSRPRWPQKYTMPGVIYHKANQYKKEKKLYRIAVRYFPNDPELIYNQVILELTEGDTVAANKDIRKYISVRKGNSWAEADITASLASIYSEAGMLDKAEAYYRKAHVMLQDNPGKLSSMQINNPYRLNNLTWFLIDKGRNITEGLELADRALILQPDNYLYLDCKGWGLYKQSKHEEALKFLEKSWSLKPVYDHDIYLHLEAVKKAVASQNQVK